MKKTTVYLPDELKERLEETAKLRGMSEAEAIRCAIDAFAVDNDRRPRIPLFSSGEVAPVEDWDEAMRGFGSD